MFAKKNARFFGELRDHFQFERMPFTWKFYDFRRDFLGLQRGCHFPRIFHGDNHVVVPMKEQVWHRFSVHMKEGLSFLFLS